MGCRALLVLLFHLCIDSCHLNFLALKACSWKARRGTTRTDKVSSSLLFAAEECKFLLTLLPVPEPWKALKRLQDLDQPSDPLAREWLYPVVL